MLIRLALAAALAGTIIVSMAHATDLPGEITTAAAHARLASQAASLDMVHLHLQHTVNCLVGRQGKYYDPTATNPCAGSGTGAIPDENDPARNRQLRTALVTAERGINSNDIATAKRDANSVYTQLQKAK